MAKWFGQLWEGEEVGFKERLVNRPRETQVGLSQSEALIREADLSITVFMELSGQHNVFCRHS